MSNFGSSSKIGIWNNFEIGPSFKIEMDPYLVLELKPIFLKIMLFGEKENGTRI
jgi:hypothetical protein